MLTLTGIVCVTLSGPEAVTLIVLVPTGELWAGVWVALLAQPERLTRPARHSTATSSSGYSSLIT